MVNLSNIILTFYVIILFGIVLFYGLLFGYRKKVRILENKLNNLEDVLFACPLSVYVEIERKKERIPFFSRRLCLFFNLLPEEISWQKILTLLDDESKEKLEYAFQKLKKSDRIIKLNLKNKSGSRFFSVYGQKIYTKESLSVLWFNDCTDSVKLIESKEEELKKYAYEKRVFFQMLDLLPVSLCLMNKKEVLYKNKMCQERKVEDFLNVSCLTDPRYKGYCCYWQKELDENELNISSKFLEYKRTVKFLLKEMKDPVCTFDSKGKIIYFNEAFSEIWKVPVSWMKKDVNYEDFLVHIQEKGLLPMVQDFSKFKKEQLSTFYTLVSKKESYIYLPDNQVLEQVMFPYIDGGIMMHWFFLKKSSLVPKKE